MRSRRPAGTGEPGGLFSGEANTPRRRWLALIAASMVLQFSYWPIVIALSASLEGDDASAAAITMGLAVAPMTFVVLAFVSRHRRAPGAVLRAMSLFLLVGMPVVLLDPLAGVFAGFAAGGAVALRPLPEGRPYLARVIAVVAGTIYMLALTGLGAGAFAIMSGAALPLAVSGIADEVVLGRAAARARDVDA